VDRILIVRLGALGDIVHAIPVAAALRRAFPAARLDWLVAGKHRPILDLVTVIDSRIVVRDGSLGLGAVGVIPELRRGRYDVALDLQGLLKSAALARASGAGRVVGFAPSYLRERTARPFYTEVYDPGSAGVFDPRETRHVVQVNLSLLECLGITAPRIEFPIAAVDSEAGRSVERQIGPRYVLLNPGAAWPNKRWPPERFGALASAIRSRHGLRSAVTWGPGEKPLADAVAAASGGTAIVSPPTSVSDLVALARGAALVVSGDTGPAHIAAAVGAPIVGIYGPTRPSRNGPWLPSDVTVSRDAVCQCHHLRTCRLSTMCLMDIGVDEVVSAVDRRLAVGETRVS